MIYHFLSISIYRFLYAIFPFFTFYPKICKKMSFHTVSIYFPTHVLYNSNVIYQ